MNNPHIMHLRSMNPLWVKGSKEDKFQQKKRGITVYGEVTDKNDDGSLHVTFSWAIQNPKDQYCKVAGVEIAKARFDSNSMVTINCDYYPDFPMKYQFFNAVALAREHVKNNPSALKEDIDFLDLTFGTLCQIAYDNQWFYNVDATQVPKIHPEIMINFVSRVYDSQFTKKCTWKSKYIDPLVARLTEKTNRYAV